MDAEAAFDDHRVALEQRYGRGSLPPAGPWSPAIELLLSHRSVRGYQGRELPVGTFETLVAAAQSAATSSNMQTWSVIAVRDASRTASLAALRTRVLEDAPEALPPAPRPVSRVWRRLAWGALALLASFMVQRILERVFQ